MSECIAIRHQPAVGGLAVVVLFRDGEREGEGDVVRCYITMVHVGTDRYLDDDDVDDDDDQTEPSSAAPLFSFSSSATLMTLVKALHTCFDSACLFARWGLSNTSPPPPFP